MEDIDVGHGDHWKAILKDTGSIADIVRNIIEKGIPVAITDELKLYYDSHQQEKAFFGIEYGDTPICGLAVIERDPDSKDLVLTTAYPFLKNGVLHDMEITAINADPEYCEATVACINRDGAELSFFDPLYVKNQFILETGQKYEFSIAAMAYNLEKLENTELIITEGPAIEMEREKVLKENPDADITKITSVKFDLGKLRSLLPHDDEPGDAEFQTVVEEVAYSHFEGIEICRMPVTFNLGNDRNIAVNLYATEQVLKGYRPQIGDPIRGNLWLQGYPVQRIDAPESWAELEREDSTVERLQKAFAADEYLSDLPVGVKALGSSIVYSGLNLTRYGNYGRYPDIPAFLVKREDVEINVWVRSYIENKEPGLSFSEEEITHYLETSKLRGQKGVCVVVVCEDIGSGYTFKIVGIEELKELTGQLLMVDYIRKDTKEENILISKDIFTQEESDNINDEEIDFTIYKQTSHVSKCPETGNIVTTFRAEKTQLDLPEKIREKILQITKLSSIKIYDGPYYCGGGVKYSLAYLPKGRNLLYVHYQTEFTRGTIGRGWVIIFDHDTCEVVYDGDDGME